MKNINTISLDRTADEKECVVPREKSLLAANTGYSNQVFLQHFLLSSALHSSAPSSPDKLDSEHRKSKIYSRTINAQTVRNSTGDVKEIYFSTRIFQLHQNLR